eukprot:jgi/Mesen1/9191/ME000591S08508
MALVCVSAGLGLSLGQSLSWIGSQKNDVKGTSKAEEYSVYDFTVKYKDEDVSLSEYKNKGFTLLAFPCNQFGGQAPGSSEEEREYAFYKFGFELDVKGAQMDPLYGFLKKNQPGEIEFLVDRNGKPIRRYKPASDPLSFEKDVVATLAGKPLPAKERTFLGAP